jgi:hypothetical protein
MPRGMIITAEVGTSHLADLIKQVQAGDEAAENGISSDTAHSVLNIPPVSPGRVIRPLNSEGRH